MNVVVGSLMIFFGIYIAGTASDNPLLIFIGIMMAGLGPLVMF